MDSIGNTATAELCVEHVARKAGNILAVCAFGLTLFLGIGAGVGPPHVVVRAFISAIVFGTAGTGIGLVLASTLREAAPGAHEQAAQQQPAPGTRAARPPETPEPPHESPASSAPTPDSAPTDARGLASP